MHDTWDAPPQFISLHWDGEKVTWGDVAVIVGFHPDAYPALLTKKAGDAVLEQRQRGEQTLYAFAVISEGHSVLSPPPGASTEARRQYERDRRNRTFHERPDAVENVFVFCADIHGRVWSATEVRDAPGVINEAFYPPARTEKALGGQLVNAIRAVAVATGAMLHGLPTD
jgi:hypothetical protein